MGITLQEMQLTDLEDILRIRNDPETFKFLHTQTQYTLEECNIWFLNNKPIWYVIREDQKIVGYIRTSNWDFTERSIWIGCDIDKEHRRKGIAFAAYTKMLELLQTCHWKTVKLSVLKYNSRAFSLYKKLGFEIINETSDSFIMEKKLNDYLNTKKGIKVVACYFGDRRFDSSNHNPNNAKDVYNMLQFLWKIEQNVDQGYPYDICFVHNQLKDSDPVSNIEFADKCKKFLDEIEHKKTKNGKAIVLHRENFGISFGAFDHAFNTFKNEYDFWFFTEDDQLIIKENTFLNGLIELHRPKTKANGFIASVGVNREWGPGANGGCGITTREILNKVTEINYSSFLGRGSLPFYYSGDFPKNSIQTTKNEHLWHGEVMFTKIIHDMGYYLEEHPGMEINLSWKDTRFNGRRTKLCLPYENWMDNIDLEFTNINEKLIFNDTHIESNNKELIKIQKPWNKDKLISKWLQDNGDSFCVRSLEDIIFNNYLNGSFKDCDDNIEIHWNNGIVYSICKEELNQEEYIKVKDSCGNIFNIKKVTT